MQTHWLLSSATKLNIAQNWARGRSAAPKRAMSYRVPSEVIRKSGLKRRKRTTNEEAEEAPDLSPAQVQDGKGTDPLVMFVMYCRGRSSSLRCCLYSLYMSYCSLARKRGPSCLADSMQTSQRIVTDRHGSSHSRSYRFG